ncbi:30S ribosomal protein S20 [Mycoplasmopsis phocirhinis]|uniref:Small ribosomal subunit protein bS20 n=1 Tax=Mycoplasmopsis phocirhinis TaxID=142650 RepID=A0A4P6MMZ1_9BACT|nr:30S ribosomal protein S20 [Mycoplasmopsis phocirhinis]QBF34343.1 30S ribosomal protein S20 [Mycoplasmopsis phocirhinis]
MANIKSKIKHIAKSEQNRLRNNAMKTRVRKAIRAAREAVLSKDEKATELVQKAHSIIATAVQKGVFHPNKGARKSSRLDKFVNTQNAVVQTQ